MYVHHIKSISIWNCSFRGRVKTKAHFSSYYFQQWHCNVCEASVEYSGGLPHSDHLLVVKWSGVCLLDSWAACRMPFFSSYNYWLSTIHLLSFQPKSKHLHFPKLYVPAVAQIWTNDFSVSPSIHSKLHFYSLLRMWCWVSIFLAHGKLRADFMEGCWSLPAFHFQDIYLILWRRHNVRLWEKYMFARGFLRWSIGDMKVWLWYNTICSSCCGGKLRKTRLSEAWTGIINVRSLSWEMR